MSNILILEFNGAIGSREVVTYQEGINNENIS
jgi:hypothetical protein